MSICNGEYFCGDEMVCYNVVYVGEDEYYEVRQYF